MAHLLHSVYSDVIYVDVYQRLRLIPIMRFFYQGPTLG